MKKRIKKKIQNRVDSWIIYKNPNGTYNSLGLNRFGEVPSHARPLHPDSETLEEALNHFSKGFKFPLVELNKEEENMLFFDRYPTHDGGWQTGDRDKWGVWGQRYLLKKVSDGCCKYVSK
ncbi:hypothetical protein [Bacillus velezensis]|uniref:hypothetical protein n=1 Tax=Bacillus velezensis TaxID=492670 RepID=UPI002FFE7409